MQYQLVKKLFDKEAYERYSKYVSKRLLTDEHLLEVYNELSNYYDSHTKSISPIELKQAHLAGLGGATEAHIKAIKEVYSNLDLVECDDPVNFLLEKLERNAKLDKAIECYDDGKIDEFVKIVKKIDEVSGLAKIDFDHITVEEMQAAMEKADGLVWSLPVLNDVLEGFGEESSLLITARPDTGKTSFLVRNAVEFMRQGRTVLHFSISEDTKFKLNQRYIQAAFGVDNSEFSREMPELIESFNNEYGAKLFMKNVSRLTTKQIEETIVACKPDVVIYDQYQKVKISHGRDARSDEVLTQIVQELKALAKEYQHGIICGTQAASSAEMNDFKGNKQKKWVGLNDIAGSKTGVPGEFQTIIGIGSDTQPMYNHYLNDHDCVKVSNKYFNVAKSKDGHKGRKFVLALDPFRCQWYEKGEMEDDE